LFPTLETKAPEPPLHGRLYLAEPPMPSLAPERPPVRHGQTLDYDALLAEAQEAFEASGQSQSDVARTIGKHRSTVNRALKTAGPTFATVQREIIAALTAYAVKEDVRVTFRVERKGREA